MSLCFCFEYATQLCVFDTTQERFTSPLGESATKVSVQLSCSDVEKVNFHCRKVPMKTFSRQKFSDLWYMHLAMSGPQNYEISHRLFIYVSFVVNPKQIFSHRVEKESVGFLVLCIYMQCPLFYYTLCVCVCVLGMHLLSANNTHFSSLNSQQY